MPARELYKHESDKIRAVVDSKAVHLLDKQTGKIITYRYTEDQSKIQKGIDWDDPEFEINLLEFEKLWEEAEQSPQVSVNRIISGGQTGADRGGLDAAIALNDHRREKANGEQIFDLGGWCPFGRKADDGQIPGEYSFLTETKSRSYSARTRKNIEDANATIIFVDGGMSGGSLLTADHCKKKRKIHLVLSLLDYSISKSLERTEFELDGLTWLLRAGRVRNWLIAGKIKTLNVAGSREKKAPGIQNRVGRFMVDVLR